MDIFGGRKRLISYLSLAFIVLSIAKIVLLPLSFLPLDSVKNAFLQFRDIECFVMILLFSFLSSFFVTDESKVALLVSFCVMLSSAIFHSFSSVGYGVLFSVLLSILLSLFSQKLDRSYLFIINITLSIVVAVLFGVLYPNLLELLKLFASAISGKGALFGVVSDFYSVAFSNTFSDLFYYADYSVSQLVDERIVSGVVSIFSSNGIPSSYVSKYLSGKYFVSVFLSVGSGVALFSRLDDRVRLSLVVSAFATLITGDTRLISAFLVLYNPFVYIGYLFCVLVSYFVARFVDIGIGFVDGGNIIELFKYCHKWVYFILIGLILGVLIYFVFQLVLSRFDFDKRRVLPRDARRIVNALGGDSNILRIRNSKVYVKNPNLIDILHLDCEIHGDEITLFEDDLDILQKYF